MTDPRELSREELHTLTVATLRDQDYGHQAQPSALGMAWAIVNAIKGQR